MTSGKVVVGGLVLSEFSDEEGRDCLLLDFVSVEVGVSLELSKQKA